MTWEEAQNRLLCNLYVLLFVKCILGVVQQLRGPNFTQLWPPTPLPPQVDNLTYYQAFINGTNYGLSAEHLPTSSCPRIYWMTPQQSLLSWSELCLWGLGWSTLCFWLCVGEHSAYSNIFYQKFILLTLRYLINGHARLLIFESLSTLPAVFQVINAKLVHPPGCFSCNKWTNQPILLVY